MSDLGTTVESLIRELILDRDTYKAMLKEYVHYMGAYESREDGTERYMGL